MSRSLGGVGDGREERGTVGEVAHGRCQLGLRLTVTDVRHERTVWPHGPLAICKSWIALETRLFTVSYSSCRDPAKAVKDRSPKRVEGPEYGI